MLESGHGQLPCALLSLSDWPQYLHRGIMIDPYLPTAPTAKPTAKPTLCPDTGRRFYPVPLVRSILDGMAAYKLN
eukprot:gene5789-5716_t